MRKILLFPFKKSTYCLFHHSSVPQGLQNNQFSFVRRIACAFADQFSQPSSISENEKIKIQEERSVENNEEIKVFVRDV